MKTETSKESTDAAGEGAGRSAAVAYPTGILELDEGVHRVRFARDEADLERVLRLRFDVFNAELGEGLESSWASGLDEDEFDRGCHHLMLEHANGELVGTYRMQTAEMARAGSGFYCDQEFELSHLPDDVLAGAVELGRACIARAHRNGLALFALWRGLASYLSWSRKRYLFGCCSLSSQDPRDGAAMLARLTREGRVSRELAVVPRPSHACPITDEDAAHALEVPRLFGTYLRYGAEACGPPAIDRAFGTIDFLIVLDLASVKRRVRRLFFAGLPDPLRGPEAR